MSMVKLGCVPTWNGFGPSTTRQPMVRPGTRPNTWKSWPFAHERPSLTDHVLPGSEFLSFPRWGRHISFLVYGRGISHGSFVCTHAEGNVPAAWQQVVESPVRPGLRV